jgi:putative toxin-antitoxin system antitoxin component (TIGR02293 family)
MHGSGKPGNDQGPTRKAEVVSIARLAVEVFGSPTEAARWLVQPAMGLNRQRPIDMIGSGGIAEVALFLGRLEYEVYA